MRAILAASMLVLLSACATTPSQWQTDVVAIQAALPIAESALGASGLGANAAVNKAELALNADVAALSATPAPTTAATLLADVQTLVAALPSSTLSPQHQAEVSALLTLAKLLAASSSATVT